MNDKTELRVELLPDERKRDRLTPEADPVALVFSTVNGAVVIREVWECRDEVWEEHFDIVIPQRVWNMALPWVTERLDVPAERMER